MKKILINSHKTQIHCLYMEAKYRFLDCRQDKINTPAKKKEKMGSRHDGNCTEELLQVAANVRKVTQDLINNQRSVDESELVFHLSTGQRFKTLILTGVWSYEEMDTVCWWEGNEDGFPGGQFHSLNRMYLWPSEPLANNFYHKEIIGASLSGGKLRVCVCLLLQAHTPVTGDSGEGWMVRKESCLGSPASPRRGLEQGQRGGVSWTGTTGLQVPRAWEQKAAAASLGPMGSWEPAVPTADGTELGQPCEAKGRGEVVLLPKGDWEETPTSGTQLIWRQGSWGGGIRELNLQG